MRSLHANPKCHWPSRGSGADNFPSQGNRVVSTDEHTVSPGRRLNGTSSTSPPDQGSIYTNAVMRCPFRGFSNDCGVNLPPWEWIKRERERGKQLWGPPYTFAIQPHLGTPSQRASNTIVRKEIFDSRVPTELSQLFIGISPAAVAAAVDPQFLLYVARSTASPIPSRRRQVFQSTQHRNRSMRDVVARIVSLLSGESRRGRTMLRISLATSDLGLSRGWL